MMNELGVRWTIGDVSDYGFEALRESICGAFKLFGSTADYCVCVHGVRVSEARRRTGQVPGAVAWLQADHMLPEFLAQHLNSGIAEGVAWKLAPLRCFPGRFELSLDSDCFLWDMPDALAHWLALRDDTQVCLVAEDVATCLGRFAALCADAPRNLGIRGLPPAFDLERALKTVLTRSPGPLESELDEQGLQLAALSLYAPPLVVAIDDVSVCSPFPPHRAQLGHSGAHFCGLNAKRVPWDKDGRPAVVSREHWEQHRATVRTRVAPAGARKQTG